MTTLAWFERFARENWTRRRGIENRQEPNERAEYWRQRFIMATGAGGENGEVLELLKKHARDGHLDEHQLALEIGDALVYLARIAHEHQLTLEDCMRLVVGKLKRRNVHGKEPAAEANREELLQWAAYGHLVDGYPYDQAAGNALRGGVGIVQARHGANGLDVASVDPSELRMGWREAAVAEAVLEHRHWPAELTSGVLFWRGERITRAEFEAEAAKVSR